MTSAATPAMSPAAYDLTPVLALAFVALLLATCIGTLWWLKTKGLRTPLARLASLTALMVFLTFDLVVFGAFTRLTDSGLGCPDWPGCYGFASPLGAKEHIQTAQDAMPTGPVTHHKAWIEMIHRFWAMALGVLVIALVALSWRWRRALPQHLSTMPWWAVATLLWILVQGAFGAWTVTLKLMPAIVTLHLLGGMLLLALLVVQAVRYAQAAKAEDRALAWPNQSPQSVWRALPPQTLVAVRRATVLVLMLLVLQLALGAWVSSNYAVLVCDTFPKCQGSWWPLMDWQSAFTIWRPLGFLPNGQAIPIEALTAIHYAHRLMAYVLLPMMAWLAWRWWRLDAPLNQAAVRGSLGDGAEAAIEALSLRRYAKWLWALAALQLLTGLSNVVLGWPLLAALMHTGGAAALVVVLVAVLALLGDEHDDLKV